MREQVRYHKGNTPTHKTCRGCNTVYERGSQHWRIYEGRGDGLSDRCRYCLNPDNPHGTPKVQIGDMKECKGCHRVMPATRYNFYINPRGYVGSCYECRREKAYKWNNEKRRVKMLDKYKK